MTFFDYLALTIIGFFLSLWFYRYTEDKAKQDDWRWFSGKDLKKGNKEAFRGDSGMLPSDDDMDFLQVMFRGKRWFTYDEICASFPEYSFDRSAWMDDFV